MHTLHCNRLASIPTPVGAAPFSGGTATITKALYSTCTKCVGKDRWTLTKSGFSNGQLCFEEVGKVYMYLLPGIEFKYI